MKALGPHPVTADLLHFLYTLDAMYDSCLGTDAVQG